MRRALIICMVAIFVVSLASCQSRIVGQGDITGAVVSKINYGELKEERYGEGYIAVKEFPIRVTREGYSPNVLQVTKGDSVRLIMYPSDTDHGFVLPAYGINEHLNEGNYKTIEFVADMDGEYGFFSNVYAGPNTKNIYGTLLVVTE